MVRRSRRAAGVLGIVAGAALVIGSPLTWVVLSFDSHRFGQDLAEALGEDASRLGPIDAVPAVGQAGTASAGRFTMGAGIVVLVVAMLLLITARARSVSSKLMILGGVVGAGVPLSNVLTTDRQLDGFVEETGLGAQFRALRLSADAFKDAVGVRWATGVWICAAGGVIAIVAGILAARAPAAPAAASGSGWVGDDVTVTPSAPVPPEDRSAP